MLTGLLQKIFVTTENPTRDAKSKFRVFFFKGKELKTIDIWGGIGGSFRFFKIVEDSSICRGLLGFMGLIWADFLAKFLTLILNHEPKRQLKLNVSCRSIWHDFKSLVKINKINFDFGAICFRPSRNSKIYIWANQIWIRERREFGEENKFCFGEREKSAMEIFFSLKLVWTRMSMAKEKLKLHEMGKERERHRERLRLGLVKSDRFNWWSKYWPMN